MALISSIIAVLIGPGSTQCFLATRAERLPRPRIGVAMTFPLLPVAHWFGFVQPPGKIFLYLTAGTNQM
jgi:hypothetical protein